MRRFGFMIDFISDQKIFQRLLFFFCGNLFSRLVWWSFSASVLKNVQSFFSEISAGTTAFFKKKSAVNINSHYKFHDNGASAVLSRLTAVSAELPAIFKKITVNLEKKSIRLAFITRRARTEFLVKVRAITDIGDLGKLEACLRFYSCTFEC